LPVADIRTISVDGGLKLGEVPLHLADTSTLAVNAFDGQFQFKWL